METKFIVTTVYDPDPDILNAARLWAKRLGAIFTERERMSLQTLMNTYQTNIILVASKEGPVAHTPGGRYFFHLSMAELRIKNLAIGKHDHMVSAMGIVPGMSVLDCTLGLASDAIVASYITGSSGVVVGIENSPLLAFIAEIGLQSFIADDPEITAALRRVEVRNADHLDYICQLPDKCFDIVFFDPMFRIPVHSSSNLKPLRFLADSRPLNARILEEARRVARKRIVIKEAKESAVFNELRISRYAGGKYSSIQYGIIEVEY